MATHEAQDYEEFCRRNEAYRKASTKALTYSGMTIPTIVSLSYVNYAVSACVGGLFAMAGLTDLGTVASYLVYVRQSAMPMNQFTQQINGSLRRRAHFRDDEREAGGGRRQSDPV